MRSVTGFLVIGTHKIKLTGTIPLHGAGLLEHLFLKEFALYNRSV